MVHYQILRKKNKMEINNGYVIGRFGMGGTHVIRKATIIDYIKKWFGVELL